MVEVAKRKPKNFFDDELFREEFDRIEKMFEEIFREGFPDTAVRGRKPLVYGFSVTADSRGKPQARKFGHVQKTDAREPLVDVIDGEKEVTVVAELPGVEKQFLKLNVEGRHLNIAVTDPSHRFSKRVALPAEVFENESNATLKNGILEVRLKKKNPSAKAKGIKVE